MTSHWREPRKQESNAMDTPSKRSISAWKEKQKVIRKIVPGCSKKPLKSYMKNVELLRPTRGALKT